MQDAIHSSLLYLCGTLRKDIEALEQRVKALEAKSIVHEVFHADTLTDRVKALGKSTIEQFCQTTTTAPTPITLTTPNGPTT